MDEGAPNNGRQEFGPIVGAILIVGLLVIGGLYFLSIQGQKLNEGDIPSPPEGTSTPQTTNL